MISTADGVVSSKVLPQHHAVAAGLRRIIKDDAPDGIEFENRYRLLNGVSSRMRSPAVVKEETIRYYQRQAVALEEENNPSHRRQGRRV